MLQDFLFGLFQFVCFPVINLTQAEVLLGLVGAEVLSFTKTEGQSITARCYFGLSGNRKFFCKGECKKDDILIETTSNTAHNGRYSLEYEGTYARPALFVTIKQLTQLDSGWYKCGLSNFFTEQHQNINLTVKAASTTITPVSATTGVFSERTSEVQDFVFPVVVSVPVLVLLVVAVFLFLYKRKTKRNFDGVKASGNLDKNMKSSGEVSIYQSLSPATKDQDQTYSTLSHMHRA